MQLGIVLDGAGRLGQPAAVTALARAADELGYRSIWCLGPWATTLVGAVAVVTTRVQLGLESPVGDDLDSVRAMCGDRLVIVEHLPTWSAGMPNGSGRVRVRVASTDVGATAPIVLAARIAGFDEVVVQLIDNSDVDGALGVYAELAELAESDDGSQNRSSSPSHE